MRTTPEETERTDRAILEAAIAVFTSRGYESANMQDIADEVGISRGPLYYRYKTKADLFEAALRQSAEKTLDDYQKLYSQNQPVFDMIENDLNHCTESILIDRYSLNDMVKDTPELKKSQEVLEEYLLSIVQIREEAAGRAVDQGELKKEIDIHEFVSMVLVFENGLCATMRKTALMSRRGDLKGLITSFIRMMKFQYGA